MGAARDCSGCRFQANSSIAPTCASPCRVRMRSASHLRWSTSLDCPMISPWPEVRSTLRAMRRSLSGSTLHRARISTRPTALCPTCPRACPRCSTRIARTPRSRNPHRDSSFATVTRACSMRTSRHCRSTPSSSDSRRESGSTSPCSAPTLRVLWPTTRWISTSTGCNPRHAIHASRG